ncbi:MAG: ATP-binding cassette domain-containing protein, partial [Armatimonadia bacterium]|nr:ATP-binding cassette domain-containing protein [Armatimonadia bacterium]
MSFCAGRAVSGREGSGKDGRWREVIEVVGLSGNWGSFELRDIALQVGQGEYRAIVGPCGAGKSLLLQCVAGLHPGHGGTVLLAGEEMTRQPPERRRLGYLPQEGAIFPHLSVRDNIAYGLRHQRVSGAEADKRFGEVVELLGLESIADRRDPTSLSGGEAQKVCLARALAIRPRALLLDEPLGSMDYQSSEEVAAALGQISETLAVAVLHITHDYTEAASLADTVTVMRDGAIVQEGDVHGVFWHPASRFVAEFMGVENVLRAEPAQDGLVAVGDLRIATESKRRFDRMYVSIRPQDVLIGDGAQAMSNAFSGAVRAVTDEGLSV